MKRILLLLSILSISPQVFAYLDPASGSFMIQMLIASLIGAGLSIKMYYKSFKEKLSALFFPKKAQDLPKEPDQENS